MARVAAVFFFEAIGYLKDYIVFSTYFRIFDCPKWLVGVQLFHRGSIDLALVFVSELSRKMTVLFIVRFGVFFECLIREKILFLCSDFKVCEVAAVVMV